MRLQARPHRGLQGVVDCILQPGYTTLDVHSRLVRISRQLLDFRGHHGETLTKLAGPRRFDRRIDRQHIRLSGNLAHLPDDAVETGDHALDFAQPFLTFDAGVIAAFAEFVEEAAILRHMRLRPIHQIGHPVGNVRIDPETKSCPVYDDRSHSGE